MNLRDLIDALEDVASEHGDDIEVRLAQQPRWAFEYSLNGDTPVAVANVKEHGRRQCVAYIAEGQQLNYLPQAAAVALGWAEARDEDEDEEEDEEGAPAPEPLKDMDGTYYHAPAKDDDNDDEGSR